MAAPKSKYSVAKSTEKIVRVREADKPDAELVALVKESYEKNTSIGIPASELRGGDTAPDHLIKASAVANWYGQPIRKAAKSLGLGLSLSYNTETGVLWFSGQKLRSYRRT